MNNQYFTLFISDLHLDPSSPTIADTFFHFLDHIAIAADALYILGDFFEAYIGDDDNDPFLQKIKYKLADFTQLGIPVYLMHGNRDFLIGQSFAAESGVFLICDPTYLTLYHQTYLLMHGDSLCTQDKSHQRFRKIAKNKWMQKLFLLLSLSFRKKMAAQLREKSKQVNQQKPADIMDVSEETVIHTMKQYHVHTLIHGHTHRCATHDLFIDHQSAKRIVLDAWHQSGHYLRIDEDGSMESVHFNALSSSKLSFQPLLSEVLQTQHEQ